ncbi:hypothetical protein [Methylobacterium indicum]|uniref:hypothetical protein n=1 Tax=Methylobacterium indicum TaxID=1775910 RepID=UPI00138F45C6|nr:hypothetical protein [Methylobacterium indicum]
MAAITPGETADLGGAAAGGGIVAPGFPARASVWRSRIARSLSDIRRTPENRHRNCDVASAFVADRATTIRL